MDCQETRSDEEYYNELLRLTTVLLGNQKWNVSISWIMAPLALLLFFSSYKLVGYIFFSLLFTSLALLFSTVLYMWKNKAVLVVDDFAEGNCLSLSATASEENRPQSIAIKNESVTQAKESQEEQASDDDDSGAPSLDHKVSENECQDVSFLSTSEDYDEVDHTPDECSDGTISDEDSLIEIALPSGHFVGHHHKEESKYNNCSLQQKKRELSAEALFNQQSLMEFLAEFNEMNEEENLIEIDIAMGSIKCSRFEIEA
ncbi:hypothetical protein Fmac_020587 [Flemingia macrophylla]|uniref:Uncharacterized protein n=1 Tax=Flemingia macrophylla TaxID=520843 RepID=A0ABD1LUH5_9FABA